MAMPLRELVDCWKARRCTQHTWGQCRRYFSNFFVVYLCLYDQEDSRLASYRIHYGICSAIVRVLRVNRSRQACLINGWAVWNYSRGAHRSIPLWWFSIHAPYLALENSSSEAGDWRIMPGVHSRTHAKYCAATSASLSRGWNFSPKVFCALLIASKSSPGWTIESACSFKSEVPLWTGNVYQAWRKTASATSGKKESPPRVYTMINHVRFHIVSLV